jgi:hypothetical protein
VCKDCGKNLENPARQGHNPATAYQARRSEPPREVGAAESAADQTKGGSAMTAVEILAISVVFITGMITGVIFLVSLASRREDRRAKLSREAPDRVTLAGRLLTGLYVRRPGDGPRYGYPDDDQAKFSGPRQGSGE